MSLNAKQNLVGTVVIGKPNATVKMTETEGGYKITVTDPNGVQELLIPNGEMNGIENIKVNDFIVEPDDDGTVNLGELLRGRLAGEPSIRRVRYSDIEEGPILVDGKIKRRELPEVTEEELGAMSAADKVKLDGIQEGADKTVVNQKVEKNSGLPVAAGAVRYELDKMQSKFEGKWVYEWDGNTEGRESVVGTYYTYYKVSDDTPTVEELSKLIEVMMYDPARDTLTVGYVDDYTTEHGYCELTAGGIQSTRVYYEGNSAGVSAGLYFHYTSRAQGTASPGYTGLLTIGNNVTAGTYGGWNANQSYYNIPNVTVDEYGRITQASNSVLPVVDSKTNGLMPSVYYFRMSYIAFRGSTGRTIPAGSTTYGDDAPAWTLYSLGAFEFPTIDIFGKYTDSNGTVHVIPIDWRLVEVINSSGTYQYNVYISIPEALPYDVVCTLRSNYSTTSSGM